MAQCPKCGAEVADDVNFCPLCGAPMQAGEPADKKEEFKEKVQETAAEVKEKVGEAAEEVKEKATAFAAEVKERLEEAKAAAVADDNDVYTEDDIKKNKIYAVLAYISILIIVPLVAAKDSKFARFHTNQGLILLVCGVLATLLTYIPIVKFFAWIVEILLFVLCVMGIINAAKGEAKELPVIGKYRFIK